MPQVIFIQEHKLTKYDDIQEASNFANDYGYKSLWTPASTGQGGKPTGGTAIWAVTQLGLTKPKLLTSQHARTTIGVIEPPSYGRLALFSAYGAVSLGAKGDNLNMIASFALISESLGIPYLAGGDFNTKPAQLQRTGILKRGTSSMMAPSRSTCITRSWTTGTTLDYYIVTSGLESFFNEPTVIDNTSLPTHRPVKMSMEIKHEPVYFMKLIIPPKLPNQRPIGPAPKADQHWEGAKVMLDKAIDIARCAATDPTAIHRARQAQDKAYRYIANAAEQELTDALQVELSDEAWRDKCKRCKARRGKAPYLQRTLLTFAAVAKRPKEADDNSTEHKAIKQALHHANLLRGHALQAIRTKPPKIDNMDVEMYTDHLEKHIKTIEPHIPKEHLDLYKNIHRTATALSTRRGLPDWNKIRCKALQQANTYVQRAEGLLQVHRTARMKRRTKTWKDWCNRATQQGGGRAHRWCKEADKGKPNQVINTDAGYETSLPAQQAKTVMDKYRKLWEPTSTYIDIKELAMPDLILNESGFDDYCVQGNLRWAATSFSTKTATSYDGFHNKHWGYLADVGTTIVNRFAGLCLAMGTMPSQLTSTLAVILPKATTGFRTVGLFPSLYRVMIRQLRPSLQEWESRNPHPAFSFQGGQNSLHKVWSQAAEADFATSPAQKLHAGAVLWDMSDYFERLCRGKLLQQHAKMEFPIAASRLSLQQYAGQRLVQHGQAVEKAGYPTFGITAGCGLCSYHVQAYAGEAIRNFMLRHPNIGMNLHYDDLFSSTVAAQKETVENRLMDAMQDLQEVVHAELKANIAQHKAVVIASDTTLQRRIASKLGKYGGDGLEVSAANLGVDYTAGRSMRTTAARNHLRRRFNKNVTKRTRLMRLAKGSRRAARMVYTQGLLPSIGYGAQVWGLPPDILSKLQAWYASFVVGHGKGKSHKKVLLLKGDPTCHLALAPLATLVDLIWASLSGVQGLPTLIQICDWWQHTPHPPKRWDGIRGPVGAARRAMQMIGWTSTGTRPIVMTSREGIDINILEWGPKLVKKQMTKDWHDIIAEKLANHMNLQKKERIDFEHARKHIHLNPDLSENERATAMNFLVGGIWDVPRLIKAGYQVGDEERLCQLCGDHLDTLHHRLFDCKASEVINIRNDTVSNFNLAWLTGRVSAFRHRVTQEIKDKEETARSLSRQGLARDPAVGQPPPAQDGSTYEGTDINKIDINSTMAYVFPDGACARPFHTRLARASWGFACCDREGQLVARCFGPVWRGLPQTAPGAETVAAAAIADALKDCQVGHRLIGDNQAVVNIVNNPPNLTTLHRLHYAGIWRTARMKAGWKLIANQAEHVRSHQLEGPDAVNIEEVDPDTRHKLLGNQLADEAAGEGHAMHPELNAELLQLDRQAYKAAQQVVLLAARVLPLHPRRAHHQRQPRPDPPITSPSDDEQEPDDRSKVDNDVRHEPAAKPIQCTSFMHDWSEGEPGRWRCRLCALIANTGRSTPPTESGCRGLPVALSRVGTGHRLVTYHPSHTNPDPTPLYACELCHAAGNSRPIFADACPSTPTLAKSRGYRRLELGKHPHPRRGSQTLYGCGYYL